MRSMLPTVALAAALLAGCGTAPQGALSPAQMASLASLSHRKATVANPTVGDGPAAEAAFVAAAKAQGVTFTPDQLVELQAERAAKPNGQWAARPAMNLTAAQNLQVHFLKHGSQFRPALASAEAYLAQGNAAGSGARGTVRFFFDTTSYSKGYQTHVVRWVPTTHDFTAFMTDGTETTYYTNDPQQGRFVELPVW